MVALWPEAGAALGLCGGAVAISCLLSCFLKMEFRPEDDRKDKLQAACNWVLFFGAVLALGLWATVGTLAGVNAQGEIDWAEASCEILSGHLQAKTTCRLVGGDGYGGHGYCEEGSHEILGYYVEFGALMFHGAIGSRPSPLRVIAQRWAGQEGGAALFEDGFLPPPQRTGGRGTGARTGGRATALEESLTRAEAYRDSYMTGHSNCSASASCSASEGLSPPQFTAFTEYESMVCCGGCLADEDCPPYSADNNTRYPCWYDPEKFAAWQGEAYTTASYLSSSDLFRVRLDPNYDWWEDPSLSTRGYFWPIVAGIATGIWGLCCLRTFVLYIIPRYIGRDCCNGSRKSRDVPETWGSPGAKAAAPTIAFTVIEVTGKELPITTLSLLHTVDELTQEVVAASGGRAEQLQLVLKNKLLHDGSKTLGDCGIAAGTIVNATSKSSAPVEEAVPPSACSGETQMPPRTKTVAP